jgi:hypothetical protein
MGRKEPCVCSQQLFAETPHTQHNHVCCFIRNYFSSMFSLNSVPVAGESIANLVTRLDSRLIVVGFLAQTTDLA